MKPTLLCLLFSVFVLVVHAQAPAIEWQNTIGGNSYDELNVVKQTADGGYILGGSSASGISGDKTEPNEGINITHDYWIIKLDATGNIVWQNNIGGRNTDRGATIQQTRDGGYIVGGTSNSGISGEKTEASLGWVDYWVIKLDDTGNIIWQNTIGGVGYDELVDVRQTTDGGYIVGGISDSRISGDKVKDSIGGFDIWIVKLDPSGTIQWQNTIGGIEYDYLNSVEPTADGGYILGAQSLSNISGDKTENSIGSYDYWIIKLDAAGNIQWQNTIGGTGWDEHALVQITDGGYIVAGTSGSGISGDKTETTYGGGYDAWIVKLDTAGNILWQNTIAATNRDDSRSIQPTNDGEYILGTRSYSGIGGDKTESNFGDIDYWVLKLDASGNIVWENSIGGTSVDELTSISPTTDGGYIIGGYSSSNISSDKTENSLGGSDYWVIKLSSDFHNISGQLLTETGIPIPAATVTLSGDDTRAHITDTTGSYSFKVRLNGNYTITPSKSNDVDTNNGITTIDVLLMRRHLLGMGVLGSPYKIIAAAEVNAASDTTITVTDIALTRSLILGNITSFPTNRLWQFVRSDYVFPDNNHPFPFPSTRTYTNITTNQTNQDFIGIKLGDVNGSWDGNIP